MTDAFQAIGQTTTGLLKLCSHFCTSIGSETRSAEAWGSGPSVLAVFWLQKRPTNGCAGTRRTHGKHIERLWGRSIVLRPMSLKTRQEECQRQLELRRNKLKAATRDVKAGDERGSSRD